VPRLHPLRLRWRPIGQQYALPPPPPLLPPLLLPPLPPPPPPLLPLALALLLLLLLLTPRALRRARVLQACRPSTNLLWQHIIPHHETFSTTIQSPYISTKG
jgi:hypothetical protein